MRKLLFVFLFMIPVASHGWEIVLTSSKDEVKADGIDTAVITVTVRRIDITDTDGTFNAKKSKANNEINLKLKTTGGYLFDLTPTTQNQSANVIFRGVTETKECEITVSDLAGRYKPATIKIQLVP